MAGASGRAVGGATSPPATSSTFAGDVSRDLSEPSRVAGDASQAFPSVQMDFSQCMEYLSESPEREQPHSSQFRRQTSMSSSPSDRTTLPSGLCLPPAFVVGPRSSGAAALKTRAPSPEFGTAPMTVVGLVPKQEVLETGETREWSRRPWKTPVG